MSGTPFNNRFGNRWERWFPAIVGIVGIIIALFVWQFRLRFPFDDAFITFRYAEHVASGYGFVWNIGGPPTEGYTNFLFVLLLAGARLLTSDLLSASQIIGLISTIVTGLTVYTIGSRARSFKVGLLASAFYFFTPLTWINALSGMETSVFVMFITVAIFCAVRDRWLAAFGLALFATLTRPEGALLGMIILTMTAGVRRGSLKATVISFLFAFLLPSMIYAIWKYLYFGAWLPNSFFVKVLADSHTFLPGLQYVHLFFVSVSALAILTFGIRGWSERGVLISVLWSALLLVFYLFVLPLEGLYDRYLWSVFTMLCVTAGIGAYDLAGRLHLRSFMIPALIVLAAQVIVSAYSPRSQQGLSAHEEVWDASMNPIVRELRSLPHSDSLQFAYGDAGYVVYQSGVRHLDLFGLNDNHIAHARTKAERAAIIRSERPDLLLVPIYSRDNPAFVEDAYGLARTPLFEPLACTDAFPYPLVWLVNTESPYYFDCKQAMLRQASRNENNLHAVPAIRY